jgi:hypothetical protein
MGLSTRPKAVPVQDTAAEGKNRLAIGDLTETSVWESSEFLPFNPIR